MFRSLDDGHLEEVAGVAELQSFPGGKLIYSQQSPSKGLYVVASGRVKVFQHSPEGKEYIIHIVTRGATFAEMATLGRFPCPASVVTMESSELVFLPAEKFLHVLEGNSALCIEMMKGMAAWQCQLISSLENVVLRDSLGRLAVYLLSLVNGSNDVPPRVRLPIKKRDLAFHLALTPETLSRTFARLVELEAIRHAERGGIELSSLETLKTLAEA